MFLNGLSLIYACSASVAFAAGGLFSNAVVVGFLQRFHAQENVQPSNPFNGSSEVSENEKRPSLKWKEGNAMAFAKLIKEK